MYRIDLSDPGTDNYISLFISSSNFLDEIPLADLLRFNRWLTISLTFVSEDSE